jgi:hypothetical protein
MHNNGFGHLESPATTASTGASTGHVWQRPDTATAFETAALIHEHLDAAAFATSTAHIS